MWPLCVGVHTLDDNTRWAARMNSHQIASCSVHCIVSFTAHYTSSEEAVATYVHTHIGL